MVDGGGVSRSSFLGGMVALFTGGLDVWATPGPFGDKPMRVLISTDPGAERPQLADGGIFTFGGKRWRGVPSFVALPGGKTGLVATVDLDAYLYGVIPSEMPSHWPLSALQAQAVVARTFALGRRDATRPYDVVMTPQDQRFGGIDAEIPAVNAAVDTTAGMTLQYGGADAAVFYAACCGGHSADAAQIWGHADLPYLRGVADPYCTDAPDYRWERELPLERVSAALASHVRGPITEFSLGPAQPDGRPLHVDITADGARTSLATSDFRRAIGDDVVRSTWLLRIALTSGDAATVTLSGAGRGHGVGLCQWGARGLAAAGASAAQILAFYYPGTRVATIGR